MHLLRHSPYPWGLPKQTDGRAGERSPMAGGAGGQGDQSDRTGYIGLRGGSVRWVSIGGIDSQNYGSHGEGLYPSALLLSGQDYGRTDPGIPGQ